MTKHAPPVRRAVMGLAGVCVLAVMALTACGASTPAGGLGSGTAPTATSGRGGSIVKPCPGNATSMPGSPDLVLTERQEGSTSQVKVGDQIVVKLPVTFRWALAAGGAGPVLKGVDPQGGIVTEGADSFCVWAFRVAGAGKMTLSFNGTPLCDPKQPCPQLERAVTFTISATP